jgi:hypothetical protein
MAGSRATQAQLWCAAAFVLAALAALPVESTATAEGRVADANAPLQVRRLRIAAPHLRPSRIRGRALAPAETPAACSLCPSLRGNHRKHNRAHESQHSPLASALSHAPLQHTCMCTSPS